jgi:ABC-2 type transport system ATP-binding protein
MDNVISVRGLVKRYGRREAVAGIDLQVRRGEIFALRTFSWLPLAR